jgi:hypothetical protein
LPGERRCKEGPSIRVTRRGPEIEEEGAR